MGKLIEVVKTCILRDSERMGNSAKKFIEKINEVLSEKENAVVNIINDKLTISVFMALEKNLKNVKEINFIIRDTKFIPKNNEISREFEITPNDILYNSYDIKEKNKLKHFAKAKAMYDFIKNNVNVRKVKPYQKVNGNILIIDDDFMIQGTSSLEIYEKRVNRYDFDTTIKGEAEKSQILSMSKIYDEIWNNNDVTQDYKQELLESLEFVYKNYNPEFLYYFTLNELFGDKLDSGVERFENDSEKFKKTEIWNSLFDFQKDCVVSAIQKLQKYGGCIIADSVGLGKTFEALAVIKYFEIRNDNVLVLTPAKLYDNWRSFTGSYKDSFLNEMFNYKIMFHTDLSRTKGESKSGYELSRFDWSKFDLVVIDESHNFRNRIAKYDENDELIMNRYFKLLHNVIKSGKNTKVLLLSATPVNNSLVDLKNQISIITGDNDSAFNEEGISSVGYILKKATQVINDWEKEGSQKKDELLDNLPSDFYKLLEMMTISRSRKHITNYYGTKNIGKFSQKNKPITYYPEIDSEGKLLDFKDTNSLLEELNLSVYTPTKFIKREKLAYYIEKYKLSGNRGGKLDFETQSKGLIYLRRVNLFKRLESSVYSFSETLKRLIENIDSTIDNLQRGQQIEEELDVENEDDSYTYENFNNLFPDIAHIGIAYTTTPDEKHEIQYEISLKDFTATQYINGEPITKIDYLKDLGSKEKALEFLKQEMEYGDFGEFVSIDDNDLKKALGLERDGDGNIYDPLAKDLDNDGVPDRYDNDFRDSDYFETTYDVEDNLNARAESKEKVSEKPSILGQIKSYQSQEKQAETRENKSKEHDER